jgi:hypothetical protein
MLTPSTLILSWGCWLVGILAHEEANVPIAIAFFVLELLSIHDPTTAAAFIELYFFGRPARWNNLSQVPQRAEEQFNLA